MPMFRLTSAHPPQAPACDDDVPIQSSPAVSPTGLSPVSKEDEEEQLCQQNGSGSRQTNGACPDQCSKVANVRLMNDSLVLHDDAIGDAVGNAFRPSVRGDCKVSRAIGVLQ